MLVLLAFATYAFGCGARDSAGGYVRQSYWYCWDDHSRGGPHHLGYPVSGDHLCTDAELKQAGYP